jgi:hypothetical protein
MKTIISSNIFIYSEFRVLSQTKHVEQKKIINIKFWTYPDGVTSRNRSRLTVVLEKHY